MVARFFFHCKFNQFLPPNERCKCVVVGDRTSLCRGYRSGVLLPNVGCGSGHPNRDVCCANNRQNCERVHQRTTSNGHEYCNMSTMTRAAAQTAAKTAYFRGAPIGFQQTFTPSFVPLPAPTPTSFFVWSADPTTATPAYLDPQCPASHFVSGTRPAPKPLLWSRANNIPNRQNPH